MAIKKLSSEEIDSSIAIAPSKRGRLGRGRGRGRGRGFFESSLKRKNVLGTRHDKTHSETISVIPDEDHADRLWSNTMLNNLLHCGKVAEEKQMKKNPSAGDKGQDFVEILYQEWKKIYPNSTMNSRNIKSRLSVYKKTKGDFPHPTKRRKIEASTTATLHPEEQTGEVNQLQLVKCDHSNETTSSSMSLKEHFSSILTKKSGVINAPLIGGVRASQQSPNHVKVESIDEKNEFDLQENEVSPQKIKSQTAGLVDEVNDEFVPENANGSVFGTNIDQNKSISPSDTTSTLENVKVEFVKDEESPELGDDSSSRSSPSLSRRVSVEQACPKHWCHVFHDRDKEVECVLTKQLLDIRKELEPQFPGCDIYSPRKPKGKLILVLTIILCRIKRTISNINKA